MHDLPLCDQYQCDLGHETAVETPRAHIVSHEDWLLEMVLDHADACPDFKAQDHVHWKQDPTKMPSDLISRLPIDFIIYVKDAHAVTWLL